MTDTPTLDEVFEAAKRLSIADQQALVIRLISAREATRAEVREYESHFYNS
jgi:uncharacterized DUF497 family protein